MLNDTQEDKVRNLLTIVTIYFQVFGADPEPLAAELVRRYNEYPALLRALEELSKEVNISGLKLNINKHFSLLNAKAYADKLIHQHK